MDGFWLRDNKAQFLDAIRFLSRLPVPPCRDHAPALAVSLRYAPLAGLVIALAPAAILVAGLDLGLPSLAAAGLATLGLMVSTGALHEDGLADVADGFGGSTVQRKLEIMRDSRIGTFGALALATSLLLRIASLQAIADRSGPWAAALALLAAAALSRAFMLAPLALLPSARNNGLAHGVGMSNQRSLAIALVLALPVAVCLGLSIMPTGLTLTTGLLFSGAAALAMTRLARRQLGGVTGDVVGATQQVCELTFLLVLCAGAKPL